MNIYKNRCKHEATYNYKKPILQLTFKELREIVLRFNGIKKAAHKVQAPHARDQRDGNPKRDDDNKQTNCYFCNSSEHK